MTSTDVKSKLAGAGLTDVLLVGFLDEEEAPVRFRPILQKVYLAVGSAFLELATIGDTGRMTVTVAPTISRHAELDDDMVPAVTSLREQLLHDPDGSNIIRLLRLWSPADDHHELSCSALGVELCNGQLIFVDPSNYFGIRIGGGDLMKSWLESSTEKDPQQLELVLQDQAIERR